MNYIERKREEIQENKNRLRKSEDEYFNHIATLITHFSSHFIDMSSLRKYHRCSISFQKVPFDKGLNYYRIKLGENTELSTFFPVWEKYINLDPDEMNELITANKTPRMPDWRDDGLYVRRDRHAILKYEDLGISKEETLKLYDEFFDYIHGLEEWYLDSGLVKTFKVNFEKFVKEGKNT